MSDIQVLDSGECWAAQWVTALLWNPGRLVEIQQINNLINWITVGHSCCAIISPETSSSTYTNRTPSLSLSLSPLSWGCVLAMIHLTRQHFIRALRENRGFCHFPESFPRPGAGSTPLASPSRLPSTTLPSACREYGGRMRDAEETYRERSGQYGNGEAKGKTFQINHERVLQ